MSLKRLLAASPLAVLVAFAAHAAGFGSSHLLGGTAGPDFLRFTLACIALLALAVFLRAGLAAPAQRSKLGRRLARALPGSGGFVPLATTLLAGGAFVFAALEASEGHGLQLSTGWLGGLALAAILVAAAVRFAIAWLTRLGLHLAALGDELATGLALWFTLAPAAAAVRATGPAARLRRGRAPPPRA
jgi:hypothetical protein